MVRRMKLDHAALLISDPERSRAFYVGVLGLTEVPRPETFDFPGLWLQIGEQQLHLIGEATDGRARQVYSPEELSGGFTSHFAIEVDDLDATVAALQQRGGALVGGPRPRGDGVIQAYISDPDGHIVELMQLGG
jgi:catechol 2,3-dioxygenase-like lactoylglutathione lyase family enzyme